MPPRPVAASLFGQEVASCRKEFLSATLRQSFFWQWLLYRDKGIEPNKKPSGIDHGDQ
jgi:hypothetical protein